MRLRNRQRSEHRISIHAARVGCDVGAAAATALTPISIHAARVGCDRFNIVCGKFPFVISIHAARVGCDDTWATTGSENRNFNPRSPSGLRP